MDEGAQRIGSSCRPEEVHAPQGPKAILAEEVGGGEDLLVAFSEQEDEQRLREAARKLRSVPLRCYEPPDGEEIGPLMRVFRRFQGEVRRITLLRTRVNRSSLRCYHANQKAKERTMSE